MPTRLRRSLGLICLAALASPALAQTAAPAWTRSKPAHYVIPAGWEHHVVSVKFRDGLRVRLRDGALTDFDTQALAAAQPVFAGMQRGTWSRTHSLPEAELDRMRTRGEQNVGHALPDLNLQFRCHLPTDLDAATIIDALNALDCVELAESVPGLAPSPQAPDIRHKQGYSEPAPRGTGAGSFQGLPDTNPFMNLAGRGGHARIAVIDYGFELHPDLPPVSMLTPPGSSTPAQDVHGTSVLGVLASRNDGIGTTGMAYGAQFMFAHASDPGGFNMVASSVMVAASAVGQGGIVLVSVQVPGPNWVGPPGAQFGLVPAEWDAPTWQAIGNAVAAGVIVVEAAGNGSQDLDAPVYDDLLFGPWFSVTHDSGALIVGGGVAPAPSPPAPPPSTPPARSRLASSNYGQALDLQGWGERVATTGGGGTWTQVFSGTSGASAVVAGAAALVQSLHFERHAFYLTPSLLRAALRRSSSPQTGASIAENIGPLPDAMRAAVELRLYGGLGFAHGFGQSLPGSGGNGIELPGGTESVYTMAEFDDDGPGPNPTRLYVGGGFSKIGGRPVNNIACWNGVGWQELSTGIASTVFALAVHDADGAGPQLPQLYAGGPFGIARWNGLTWSGVGTGLSGGMVFALASIDEDGPGPLAPSLVAGGDFTNAGLLAVSRIARWRNNAWSAMGDGFDAAGVRVLEVYDADDNGPALPRLVAGGFFAQTGLGATMRSLAIWNGTAWSELGGGLDGGAYALESVPIVSTQQQWLFVGGSFWHCGGVPVVTHGFAAWTGGSWLMPWLPSDTPVAIVGFEDGSDPTLPRQRDVYVWCAGAPSGHYRLDLTTWVATQLNLAAPVWSVLVSLMVFDEDGAGVEPPSLLIGGNVFTNSASSAGIAKLFGRVPTTMTGLQTMMPTACGWPWQPTIASSGDPVLGLPFTVQFDCLPESLPLLCAGLPLPAPLPVCGGAPSPCALGVDPIVLDLGVQSGTWTFTNDPVLVGTMLAFQGIELFALPFGPSCVPPWLGIELRASDTLVITF